MKCLSCGAEITLTDGKCPHCGRVITETAIHQEDLKQYKKKSGIIKGRAGTIISENVPIVISAVVMILLIICVAVAAYVEDNAYFFRDNAIRRKSVKNYDEYSGIIKDYLDAGDYTGFSAFMKVHNIAAFEQPYEDLNLVSDMAAEYASLVSAVESVFLFGPEARIYDLEGDIRSCRRQISDFYREFEYNLSDIDEDPYKEYIYDMRDKADAVLEVYFGLDENGRAEFFESSENKQEAYLEEVILGE